MAHSAVLLAGGKSSRMGHDKAALCIGGLPLWRRQLHLLKATQPGEIFISIGEGGSILEGMEQGVLLPDAHAGCGPLGGIATALGRCADPWLLVLAVDMPVMPAGFLARLVEMAEREGRGIIPRNGAGMWEPLAAVYPRSGFDLAEGILASGERKMERLILSLIDVGMARALDLALDEEAYFENWNEPGDVREMKGVT